MYKVISSPPLSSFDKNSIYNSFNKVLNDHNIGFTKIPSRTQLFTQSEALGENLLKNYDQFLIIGIGGSSMGSRALAEITNTKNIYFLDNVDTVEFDRVWMHLTHNPTHPDSVSSLRRTAFLIVSKSGSTIEILWNYSLIENLMNKNGLKLIEQSYFVSELTNSPIASLAKNNNRPLLEVPLDVGGRFSVLTPVGLVVAKICGLSLKDIQSGADSALHDKSEVGNACELFLNSFTKNESITLFWFYNSNFRWFGAWLQQLWAESLGKKMDLAGNPAPDFSTPMLAIGACDQHSILQQVAHGTKNKFVCFYNFKSVENSQHKMQFNTFTDLNYLNNRNYGDLISTQAKATAEALKLNSVSTSVFNIDDQNTSFSTGYLFMYFQLIVATLGVHKNINPFDQPGVSLGKELTLNSLKTQI